MKFVYPAIFQKKAEGGFKAYFPDLACCEAEGIDLEETIENANDALNNWITSELAEEDGGHLPGISDEDDLTLKDGEFIRNISVTIRFYDGWDE